MKNYNLLKYKNLLFLLILLLLFSCTRDKKESQLYEGLKNITEKYQSVGMSVNLVKKTRFNPFRKYKTCFSSYFGYSDMERQIKTSKETIYKALSISKQIVAIAIMQQYEKGKLNINDDISIALGYKVRNPYFPDSIINYKQLMTHTSSILNNGWWKFLSATYNDSIAPSIQEILTENGKYYNKKMWGEYAPGKEFHYCDFASDIMVTIIEKLTNQRFDDYCNENIFKPMGIKAYFDPGEIKDIDKLAVIYKLDSEKKSFVPAQDNYKGVCPTKIIPENWPIGYNGSIYGANSSLRLTSADLTKIMVMFMNKGKYNHKRILKRKTVELMHHTFWKGWGSKGFYTEKGLQFHITEDLVFGKRMLGHGGYNPSLNYMSCMYFDEDYKFGIVFITNGALIYPGQYSFIAMEEEIYNCIYKFL